MMCIAKKTAFHSSSPCLPLFPWYLLNHRVRVSVFCNTKHLTLAQLQHLEQLSISVFTVSYLNNLVFDAKSSIYMFKHMYLEGSITPYQI